MVLYKPSSGASGGVRFGWGLIVDFVWAVWCAVPVCCDPPSTQDPPRGREPAIRVPDLCDDAFQLSSLLQTLATIHKHSPCVRRPLVCKFVCRSFHRVPVVVCHWSWWLASQAEVLQLVHALSGVRFLIWCYCVCSLGPNCIRSKLFLLFSVVVATNPGEYLRITSHAGVSRPSACRVPFAAAFGQVKGASLTPGLKC